MISWVCLLAKKVENQLKNITNKTNFAYMMITPETRRKNVSPRKEKATEEGNFGSRIGFIFVFFRNKFIINFLFSIIQKHILEEKIQTEQKKVKQRQRLRSVDGCIN